MPNIDTAIHDEIDNVVRPRKQNRDEGFIIGSPEKKTVEESKKIIKRMYNPETDQEDAEARNTILVGINKAAVKNNVDPQEIADKIYGENVINIEELLGESFYPTPSNFRLLSMPLPGLEKPNTVDKKGDGSLELSFRVDPDYTIKANFSTVKQNGIEKMFISIKPIHRYLLIDYFALPKEVKSFEEAVQLIREEIARLREKSLYKVTELEDDPRNSKGDGKKGEIPKEGKLDVNPGGNGDGGIDRENLDFEKLLTQLKNTKDEQWAFEQLDMLQNDNSGASREIINQAAINILQNQNLQHQPRNLIRVFNSFVNNVNGKEVVQVFWKLPVAKLIPFVEELARQDLSGEYVSYKNLLVSYSQLPEPYKEIYLSEIVKKFLPEKIALQDFLKNLNSLAGTRISEEDFFSGDSHWIEHLPEKYIIRETSKNQSSIYLNREALQRDGLDPSSYDAYYNRVIEFERFKRDKDTYTPSAF